jgi:CBS domain containing-hemolysin-like protein
MEDIIEELVGEIYDEHDEVIEEFKQLSENTYQIDCGADLIKMQELFNIQGEFESTTVSGWVSEQLERIPVAGDEFTFENLAVRVVEVDTKRVLTIEVTVTEPEAEKEEE